MDASVPSRRHRVSDGEVSARRQLTAISPFATLSCSRLGGGHYPSAEEGDFQHLCRLHAYLERLSCAPGNATPDSRQPNISSKLRSSRFDDAVGASSRASFYGKREISGSVGSSAPPDNGPRPTPVVCRGICVQPSPRRVRALHGRSIGNTRQTTLNDDDEQQQSLLTCGAHGASAGANRVRNSRGVE